MINPLLHKIRIHQHPLLFILILLFLLINLLHPHQFRPLRQHFLLQLTFIHNFSIISTRIPTLFINLTSFRSTPIHTTFLLFAFLFLLLARLFSLNFVLILTPPTSQLLLLIHLNKRIKLTPHLLIPKIDILFPGVLLQRLNFLLNRFYGHLLLHLQLTPLHIP